MKYFVFIISILVVFSGCSSSVETNSAANAANPAAPNSNPANTNALAATNSNPNGMQPYGNINSNAFNAANSNLKVIKYEPKKDELPYGSRNAPDDSVISSGSRGTDFIETRTFKNHPVLAKVEKIMDAKTTKYKVYLKNGKVVDAPADKMNNMAALAPVNILEAIGMQPKPQTTEPTKTEEKKDQK